MTLAITPASSFKQRPVLWLWQGCVPLGELSLLAGVGGLGKSILACELAARVSRGQLDGGLKGGPATVIYATAEDSWSTTLAPRLNAAGADLDQILEVAILDDEGYDEGMAFPEDKSLSLLRDAIEQTGARLIVMDPLVAFLSDGTDSHNDKSTRRALAPLKRLAEDLGVAIVCIVHLNKRDSRQPANRIIGSVGFYNTVRSVLLFTADPDDEDARILSHAKSNQAEKAVSLRFGVEGRTISTDSEVGNIDTVGLSWLGEAPDITADNALEGVPDREERSALAEAAHFLEEELADGPVATNELKRRARDNGLSWRTVRRAGDDLGVARRHDGNNGGWRWHWPEGGQHGQDDHG